MAKESVRHALSILDHIPNLLTWILLWAVWRKRDQMHPPGHAIICQAQVKSCLVCNNNMLGVRI